MFNEPRDSLWPQKDNPWPMRYLTQFMEEIEHILYSSSYFLVARDSLLDTLCIWLRKALLFNLALLLSLVMPPIWLGKVCKHASNH
jgi:hypothetical protein